jgi:hypothetical protein
MKLLFTPFNIPAMTIGLFPYISNYKGFMMRKTFFYKLQATI